MVEILGMKREELENFVDKPFRAQSIIRWIYQKGVLDFELMTDIPKDERRKLSLNLKFNLPEIALASEDDDGTTKLVMKFEDDLTAENVLIPSDGRLALCVSTQIGCPFDCKFCFTSKIGFKRNLKTSEIIGQYIMAREFTRRKITHIVFMGMGEPLLNLENVTKAIKILKDDFGAKFSSRKLTVSTAGITPKIKELLNKERVSLAVSLNAPDDEKRKIIMPKIAQMYPLNELISTLRKLRPARGIITFEYVLLEDFNDSDEDARRLTELIRPTRSKLNIIPFNPFPGAEFKSPTDPEKFRKKLENMGITTTLRRPRGRKIGAACGQLGQSVLLC